MLFTLENSFLKISASTRGAELHNLFSKNTNTEFLWNGAEEHWKYHAPVLFPIVGKVKNNTYSAEGSQFQLPQHGLARISDFNLINQTDNSLLFELKYSEKTLKVYPYKFSFKIQYTLNENTIKVEYIVDNLDNKTIYFSVGAHPAFMCPLHQNETMNDYYFELNKAETTSTMLLNEEGYFSQNRESYLENDNIIPLSKEVFKNDALIFDDLKSNKISLKSNKHNKTLSMDFTGFPYLALWSKPTGAPFVCIEPWFGHSDYHDFTGSLKDKEGIQSLSEGNSFNAFYTISIID